MAHRFAFVTLLTSDNYLPGALTCIHSLLDVEGNISANDFDTVCLVTPATVSVESIKALRQVFSLVIGVEAIESHSKKELQLLGRPDLAATLTKLHLFRLTQYKKLIYLDADTLAIRPLSHLFTLKDELSAAPDIGWPDCFNSGFMVLTPSNATFEALTSMASQKGSWDGGDQGLLNDYFEDWNRLSFLYNVTPSALYQYAPAIQRYGNGISVCHFIGRDKPWDRLNRSRAGPSTGEAKNDYNGLLHRWFDTYEKHYGQLSTATLASRNFGNPQSENFVVPHYTAAWDQKNGDVSYRPPTAEQLKTMFGGALSSTGGVGLYTTMPWEGREAFIGQQTQPEPPADSTPGPSSSDPNPVPPPDLSNTTESRPQSPPMMPWNPAVSGPDNTQLQMREPMDTHYSNAWDEKSRESKQFFEQPQYGSIPSFIKSHYEDVLRNTPQSARSVFPWEENQQQQKASRVFPGELQAPQVKVQASTPPMDQAPSSEPPTSQGLPAGLSLTYTNAWDSFKGIKQYADQLSKPKSPSWKVSNSPQKKSASRSSSKDRADQPSPPAENPSGSEKEGEDGDDEDEDDSEEKERMPIRYKVKPGGVLARGPSARPHMRRNEGSVGSSSRIPQIGDFGISVANDNGTSHRKIPSYSAYTSKLAGSASGSPTNSASRLAPDPSLVAPAPRVPAARVFDPSTDTNTIKKEGLAALNRFVKQMEATGGSAHSSPKSNGSSANGSPQMQQQRPLP